MEAVHILFIMVLAVLFIFIGLQVAGIVRAGLYERELPDSPLKKLEDLFETKRLSVFEISNYVSTDFIPTEEYFTDNNFCEKLRYAINNSVITGEMVKVDEEYVIFDSNNFENLIKGCAGEYNLNYLSKGIETEVCYFDVSDSFVSFEKEGDVNNPFYNYEPYIHNCYFQSDFELDVTGKNVYVYHPPLYTNTYETISKLKIFVKASAANDLDRTWNFNLYVCAQPLLSESESSATIEILNIFKNMKNLKCCGDDMSTSGDTIYLDSVYPQQFIIDFTDEDPNPTYHQILAAINAGMAEWNRINYRNIDLIQGFSRFNNAEKIYFTYNTISDNSWNPSNQGYIDSCYDSGIINFDEDPTVYYYPTEYPMGYYDSHFPYEKLKLTIKLGFSENSKEIKIIPYIFMCGEDVQ